MGDPKIKHRIRLAAEEEERRSYEGGRMPAEWLAALEPSGRTGTRTSWMSSPWIVVLFEQVHGTNPDGRYESTTTLARASASPVGCSSARSTGWARDPHSHALADGFLREILGRPANERPFVLLPVGYPAPDAEVPDLTRKSLAEVAVFVETQSETEAEPG